MKKKLLHFWMENVGRIYLGAGRHVAREEWGLPHIQT